MTQPDSDRHSELRAAVERQRRHLAGDHSTCTAGGCLLKRRGPV